MTTWSKAVLRKIAEADDLHISPLREDACLQRAKLSLVQAAMRQRAVRIIAAGLTKEVTRESVEGPINDLIDDAYRASTMTASISAR